MRGFRERCLTVGMDDYVSKPIHQRELLAAIDRWLDPGARPGSGTAGGAAGALIDRAAVLDRVEGDMELVRELVEEFLHDYPGQLAALQAAIARADGTAAHQLAHALKGAIGNFSAREASEAAQRVEALARAGDLTRAEEACAALEGALQRLEPALTSLAEEAR